MQSKKSYFLPNNMIEGACFRHFLFLF